MIFNYRVEQLVGGRWYNAFFARTREEALNEARYLERVMPCQTKVIDRNLEAVA